MDPIWTRNSNKDVIDRLIMIMIMQLHKVIHLIIPDLSHF